MSQQLIGDQLRELLDPLIPPPPPAKNGRPGRPRVDDRAALEGILLVTANGITWKKLPAELGFGSGVTCWRRLRACQEAGVWEKLHYAVLDQIGQDGHLDRSRTCLDSVSVRAKRGGKLTGANLTNRGKTGTKNHLLVTADGLPPAVAITKANRHDSMLVEPILDGLAPIKVQGRGHPRRRPGKLHADNAYDNRRVRRHLSRCRITARIVRIGVDSSERLGRHRWVVQRTISWLMAFRRLAIRYDRSATTMTALATLSVTIMCDLQLPRKDY